MGKYIDLTGKVFGEWTVIGRDYNFTKGTYWSCLCSCGTVKSRETRELVGKRKGKLSGCVHCCKNKITDISGKRFGKYLVLQRDFEIEDKSQPYFWCKCDCGNVKSVRKQTLTRGESQSCGCYRNEKQQGPGHPLWKGGKHEKDGYILVKRIGKKGYEPEHRLVWEEAHGPIPKGYIIHHKNGKRDDNRLENLELVHISKHHSGQKLSDAIKDAKELLYLHEPDSLSEKAKNIIEKGKI